MKIKLIFDDWFIKANPTREDLIKGIELSIGDFHSGSTFNATIELDAEQESELKKALSTGATPKFLVVQ